MTRPLLTFSGRRVTVTPRLAPLTVIARRPAVTLVTMTNTGDTRAVVVTAAVRLTVDASPADVTQTLVGRGAETLAVDARIETTVTHNQYTRGTSQPKLKWQLNPSNDQLFLALKVNG